MRASAVAFSPDGRHLASTGRDLKTLLWDTRTQRQVLRLPRAGDQEHNSVAFAPDGKLLAMAGNDRTIRLWDVTNRRYTSPITGHAGSVSAVAFSPDGRLLASASFD